MSEICWRGRLYDALLNPLLRRLKKWIAKYIGANDLHPVLDVCCGTGFQIRMTGRQGRVSLGLDLDCGLVRYAAAMSPDASFVCADATRIPVRSRSQKAIILSFALHDKSAVTRMNIIGEAKRILVPDGRIIILDFEKPWSGKSRIGSFFVGLVERAAGKEHFRNGRQFIAAGGLTAFLREHGLTVVTSRDLEPGSSRVVIARSA